MIFGVVPEGQHAIGEASRVDRGLLEKLVIPVWDFNYNSILRRRWWRRGSSLVLGQLYKLLHTDSSLAENMWNFGYDDTAWLTPEIAGELEELGLRPQLNKYALSLYYFVFRKFSPQIDGDTSIIELSAGTGLGYRLVKHLLQRGRTAPRKTCFSDLVFREGLYNDLRDEFIVVDVKKPETYETERRFDIIYSVENFHVIPDYAAVFRTYSGLSKPGAQIHYVDVFTEDSIKDFVLSAEKAGFAIRECINLTDRVNDSLLQQSLIRGNWNFLDSSVLGYHHQRGDCYLYFNLARKEGAA